MAPVAGCQYSCTLLCQFFMFSALLPLGIYCTHTRTFNGTFSGTTWLSWYQKGKTNLDFSEARDSEWQWHQLGRMQVCTSLQTDNHASTPPLSFLQAGCPSCRPTNSVEALKASNSNLPQNHNYHLTLTKYRPDDDETICSGLFRPAEQRVGLPAWGWVS